MGGVGGFAGGGPRIGGGGRLHDLLADLPDLQLQANLGGENVCKASLESGRGLGWGGEIKGGWG